MNKGASVVAVFAVGARDMRSHLTTPSRYIWWV